MKITRGLKIFLQWLVLVLLVGILCYSLWGVTQDVFVLSRATHRGIRFFGMQNNLPRPAPEQVQSWMTFRYINLVFHLQPQYLKTDLGITDSHYPNISINTLAKEKKATDAAELALVQQALKARLLPEAAPQP